MRPFVFSLNPPRNPVLRTLLAIAGLVLLGTFAAVAAIVGGMVLIGFGLRRLLMQQRPEFKPPHPQAANDSADGVIEGEYSVVRKSQANLFSR
jgi:hypothetical protein